MSELVFMTHFPLLRIDAESVPFGAGDLWRMPFDAFDGLTLGAFTDHRARFEATAPVFYRVVTNVTLPLLRPPAEPPKPGHSNAIELKAASNNWDFLDQLGLGFLIRFHGYYVDPAWTALLLAASAAALPQPRISVSFVFSDGDDWFHVGNSVARLVHVQGDADLEFVLLAEAAGPPVSVELIAEASALLPAVETMRKVPEFLAALHSLQFATAPPLYPAEQLTLSVVGLEALLMPEVKSGLGATFAGRLSRLLGANPEHRELLRSIAASLYDLRSAGLHGGAPRSPEEAAPAISNASGQQLLAAAALAMAGRDQPLDQVRSALDADATPFAGGDGKVPSANPPGLRRHERLLRSTTEVTAGMRFGPGISSLQPPENTLLSWSPLVGLGIEQQFRLGEAGSPGVIPLTSQEILSLEDKDISRDFIAQLNGENHEVAALAIAKDTGQPFSYEAIGADDLMRQRDLAVVALRLAGFLQFHDPELLGAYVYDGGMRHRRATILRQTVLLELRHEPEQRIGPADSARTGPFWQLLSEYDKVARHPDVDAVLVMFRRACDSRFLPTTARAGLMFSALESMLGRFRPFKEKIQLETLVSRLVGGASPAAVWFAEDGRKFRNSVAHGHWESGDQRPFDYMPVIVQAVVPEFVRCWLQQGDRTIDRPGRAFIHQVTQQAAGG